MNSQTCGNSNTTARAKFVLRISNGGGDRLCGWLALRWPQTDLYNCCVALRCNCSHIYFTTGLKLIPASKLQLNPCVLFSCLMHKCSIGQCNYITCIICHVKWRHIFESLIQLTKWICEDHEWQRCSTETDICNRNSVGLPPRLNSKVASVGMFSVECGGTPVEHWAGAGAGARKLWCDARRRRRLNFGLFAMECLVGRASLECWSRKPNGGILRAWVRSEPPVLIMWLSPLFQLSSNLKSICGLEVLSSLGASKQLVLCHIFRIHYLSPRWLALCCWMDGSLAIWTTTWATCIKLFSSALWWYSLISL